VTSVLSVRGLEGGYGHVKVLRGLDLDVAEGEVVVMLGANGAGKTTTLRALAGLIPCSGKVDVLGMKPSAPLHVRARAGLTYLPEERGIIRSLTVTENLQLARVPLDKAVEISPELAALSDRAAGLLSGGEQQILSLTRAIAGEPRLLLADEPSLGLAPMIVRRMLHLLQLAASRGAGVLLVEQYAHQALQVAHRGYVLERGTIVLQGDAAQLRDDMDLIEKSYLGMTSGELPPAHSNGSAAQ
jgi:branched-chain amino acid transport system ATP-binding protein